MQRSVLSLRQFYLGCFSLHFFLLLATSFREMFWLLGHGYTALPPSLENCWQKAESLIAAAQGRTMAPSNPLRQSLTAYMYGAGIERGYVFFAPGVPNSYKVVFEIHYPNGEVEYELPHISGRATAVRLATLLDYIGRAEYDPLRELMLKMLTYSIWQMHPNATMIRTIFGYIEEPHATEASHGKRESYKVLYAYDCNFPSPGAQPSSP